MGCTLINPLPQSQVLMELENEFWSINIFCRFPEPFFWTETLLVNYIIKLPLECLTSRMFLILKISSEAATGDGDIGLRENWVRTKGFRRDKLKALGMCTEGDGQRL